MIWTNAGQAFDNDKRWRWENGTDTNHEFLKMNPWDKLATKELTYKYVPLDCHNKDISSPKYLS